MNDKNTTINQGLKGSAPVTCSVLCDWCRHEGRGEVPAAAGCHHINGAYETDHLCADCFAWLDPDETPNDKLSDEEGEIKP